MMKPSTENQDRVKNILYLKLALLSESDQASSHALKRGIILKYYPKYIDILVIKQYDGRMISKLKRTKIIKKFYSLNLTNKVSLKARIILANKAKTVQDISKPDDPRKIIQDIKRYPSIQTINITEPQAPPKSQMMFLSLAFPTMKTSGKGENKIGNFIRMAKFMKRMSKLESLNLCFRTKRFSRVVKVLDSCRRLKDLKHLKVRFNLRDDDSDRKMLSGLLVEMKNVFKYATSLNLGELDPADFESFRKLPETCLNLKQITFGIDNCEYGEQEQAALQGLLMSLEALEKLERLQIMTRDKAGWMRDFALPISMKHVKISFLGGMWYPYEALKDFRENPVYVSLFERWSKLKNLDCLEIYDHSDSFGGYFLEVLQEILKKIPRLRSLQLVAGGIGSAFSKNIEREHHMDIVKFMKPLENINNELEVLEISTADGLFLKDGFEEEVQLPKLLSLKLEGTIFEKEFNLENYVKLFESCFLKKRCQLELVQNRSTNSEVFMNLFEQLKKNAGRGDNLEITCNILVRRKNFDSPLDDIAKGFKEFEKNPRDMKNVSLIVNAGMDSVMLNQKLAFSVKRLFKKLEILGG